MEKVHTPNAHTIDELVKFLGMESYNFAKTIIYKADDKYVAAMVRGDREINEVKLKNLVGCKDDLELAEPHIVRELTHAEVGFAGPIGLEIPVYVDKEITFMKNFVVGANETDMHYKNVNLGKDFNADHIADIRVVEEGDVCPKCGQPIKTAQGIEVGHIFKLGTKYSDALGLKYLDENGKSQTVIMGCYGIGVTRCIAGVIEQNYDENGIIWPVSCAPFEALVIPANHKNEQQMEEAEKIYNTLKEAGIDVLLDDRSERTGVKFKDADLIGIPVRIVVGKKISDGIVEYKERKAGENIEKDLDTAVKDVIEFVKSNK
jgi:prolyl-tRNA synthetase